MLSTSAGLAWPSSPGVYKAKPRPKSQQLSLFFTFIKFKYYDHYYISHFILISISHSPITRPDTYPNLTASPDGPESSLKELILLDARASLSLVGGVYVEIPAGGVPAEDLGQAFLGARGELDAGPDERGLWVGRGWGGGEDAGHAKTFLGDATEGGAAHRVVRDDVARADRWLQHGGIVVESGLRGTHAVGGG